MIIFINHRRFVVRLKGKRFYQIFELDDRRQKTAISPIFRGRDCYNHLPEPPKDTYPKYEVQRVRYVPGKHEFKVESNTKICL
jgi:hypothetical protein